MSDSRTILGLLMQNEADQSQPADDQREASWIRISEAIDEIERKRLNDPSTIPQINPANVVSDDEWNPKTAFNTRSTPRSVWRFPSRRLAFAMVAVFLSVAALLGVLYMQSSGILPGPSSTTILTDEPIPMADPDAPAPQLSQLLEFFSEADSRELIALSGKTAVEQKSSVEGLAARNKMTLIRTSASAQKDTAYWIGQKPADQADLKVLLIAREKAGQAGWQVIYPIFPDSAVIPSGQALDDYFAKQLAKRGS